MQRKRRQQRTADLKNLALRQGFTFTAEPDPGRVAPLSSGFELFQQGSKQDAPRNLMEGSAGEFSGSLFDFTYYTTESTGRSVSQQPHNRTVCIMNLREANLPRYSLRREGLGRHDQGRLLEARYRPAEKRRSSPMTTGWRERIWRP